MEAMLETAFLKVVNMSITAGYVILAVAALRLALKKLPAREMQIMQLRFGLDGRREMTQKEVADRLGISQSYISRLEKRILSRLNSELTRLSS